MKIIRNTPQKKEGVLPGQISSVKEKDGWKVLVVDDDPDILAITRLNLKTFRFEQRGLNFLLADSAQSAVQILNRESDIAVAIVDVVMESDDAGLKLVNVIRNDLNNKTIRIIIRTGQPGHAPERYVIDHYDIDDFKDKSELTAIKLYTAVRSAIKSYRDLRRIERNRAGMEMILNSAPGMYLHPAGQDLDVFFQGMLNQITSLCQLVSPHESGVVCHSVMNGCIATYFNERVVIRAGIGNLAHWRESEQSRTQGIVAQFLKQIEDDLAILDLPENALLIPLEVRNKPVGFIYLDNIREVKGGDRKLLRLFTIQCASALDNNRLQSDLRQAKKSALRMLAVASEFKDTDTSDHVKRVARQTKETALELGISQEIAEMYSEASLLHDIGKIGIPDVVLMKPGRLTLEEFSTVQNHPAIGAEILKGDPSFELAYQVAIFHHEKWDGSGYPAGLKGEQIPMAARIVAVMDVFDALVSVRPYKKAWTVKDALEEIKRCAGTHFDPQVVEAFLNLHERRGKGQIPAEKKQLIPAPRRAMDGVEME
ncbi:MAG: DUF3369 domain-containing protein [Magnetococcales bacterium]|nr:DUF3369 domain-containing protein [Magnetococcales bacterium]